MHDIAKNLEKFGITLPKSIPALFNYVPYVVAGNMVFIAGQVPIGGDHEFKGKVGTDIDMETAQAAARQCAYNILTQIREAVDGDWSRVKRCVKLGGFVNCGPDYTDMSLVINGASDVMVDVLGEAMGKHARFAVGAPSLPAGFAVEVDAIFEITS